MEDGVLGDFVEHDTAGARGIQREGLAEVPGNGFPFAVLIRGEIDDSGLGGQFLEFGDRLPLVGGDDVFRGEPVVYVDTEFFLLQVTDVPLGCLDCEVLSEELLYGLHLSGRLDDD